MSGSRERPMSSATRAATDAAFEEFYEQAERRLAVALSARYGAEVGREAALDALAWGWENWDRLRRMGNPAGYLYRVGQTGARRITRARPAGAHPDVGDSGEVEIEPALAAALDSLTVRQRQVVVLAHGYGCTHRDIAELLGLSRSSVQNHAERGLAKLRRRLETTDDG